MKDAYRGFAVLAVLCGAWLVAGIALDWPGRILAAATVGIILCGISLGFIRGELESQRAAKVESSPPTFYDPRDTEEPLGRLDGRD